MIRPDARRTQDYTKREWFLLPRDYRYFIQIDLRDVVEHEARRIIGEALQALQPSEIKIMSGINNPDIELPSDYG